MLCLVCCPHIETAAYPTITFSHRLNFGMTSQALCCLYPSGLHKRHLDNGLVTLVKTGRTKAQN